MYCIQDKKQGHCSGSEERKIAYTKRVFIVSDK